MEHTDHSTNMETLEPFILALRSHADAVADSEVDEEELGNRAEDLRHAARTYVEEVFEVCGWDNPFYDLFDEYDLDATDVSDDEISEDEDSEDESDQDYDEQDDDEEQDDEEFDDEIEISDDDLRVAVFSRHDFVVKDIEEVVNFGRELALEENEDIEVSEVEELIQNYEDALYQIARVDGWDASRYLDRGLLFAGESVELSEIDATLMEETDDDFALEDEEDLEDYDSVDDDLGDESAENDMFEDGNQNSNTTYGAFVREGESFNRSNLGEGLTNSSIDDNETGGRFDDFEGDLYDAELSDTKGKSSPRSDH